MSWLSPAKPSAPGALAAEPAPSVLDLVLDGVVVLDDRGQIIQVNGPAQSVLRGAVASLVGRDFWDAVPEEIAERHQREAQRALKSADEHSFVFNDKIEGTWLEYNIRRHLAGYVVNVRDVGVTHKLERLLEGSERYNQLVFEANPNAMWLFDILSLQILAANQAAVNFYGIPRKQFLKLAMGALFPDGEGAVLLASLETRDGSRGKRNEAQLCKQKKMDGTLVLVELACGHVSWQDHHAVLVSIADVTDRHLADRNLRRENTELEQTLSRVRGELATANRDMAAFTHALSNDLQAPLHATNGFAAMLAEKYAGVLDQPGRHYISRIQGSTRQLARLVDDLRTLVQLPVQAKALEKVDLVPLCRLIVNDLRKHDPERLVTIEMAGSLLLLCDKNLVMTALTCLLDNAWKFSSRKAESWIKLELQPAKSAQELVLRVTDNGVGFDPAYGGKLFTAFQRLHSSADFAGHGLGLAIVKRVALAHNGRVWAETAELGGASISMVFPGASA